MFGRSHRVNLMHPLQPVATVLSPTVAMPTSAMPSVTMPAVTMPAVTIPTPTGVTQTATKLAVSKSPMKRKGSVRHTNDAQSLQSTHMKDAMLLNIEAFTSIVAVERPQLGALYTVNLLYLETLHHVCQHSLPICPREAVNDQYSY